MGALMYGQVILGLLALSIGDSAGRNVSIGAMNHDKSLLVNQKGEVQFYLQGAPPSAVLRVNITDKQAGIVSYDPTKVITGQNQTFNVTLEALEAGRTILYVRTNESLLDRDHINTREAFVRVVVSNSFAVDVISDIVGWLYFVAWSVSFYPQIYENWRRKSVIGLNFDFLSLNIVGFVLYSVFNVGLLWVPPIQHEYFLGHPEGVNPVQLNDAIFSLHAVLACVITIYQCWIYEKGDQTVSRSCRFIHGGIVVVLAVCLVLSLSSVLSWLDYLYVCSYVKLFITLVKYIPQAFMNYRRKSTLGWSIGNVLLDFTGGILSVAQMFLLAYNHNDWGSIFGDPTKFGLGLFSVLFDILFIVQHYVLYRNAMPFEEIVNAGDPPADPEDPPSEEEPNEDEQLLP